MEPFTIISIIIIAILIIFARQIFSVGIKILFYLFIVFFVFVLLLDVSLDQVIDWALGFVLWAL